MTYIGVDRRSFISKIDAGVFATTVGLSSLNNFTRSSSKPGVSISSGIMSKSLDAHNAADPVTLNDGAGSVPAAGRRGRSPVPNPAPTLKSSRQR
jgi:hypothetical protein